MIEKRLGEISRVPFLVQVHGADLHCNHPLITCDQAGLDCISDTLPLHDEMRRLVALHMVPDGDWATMDVINGIQRQVILNYINLHYSQLTDLELAKAFIKASTAFCEESSLHLCAVSDLFELVASGCGSAAQIVSSTDLSASFQLPLSESYIAVGFAFNPCRKFEFHPDYVSYSIHSGGELRAQTASRSLCDRSC